VAALSPQNCGEGVSHAIFIQLSQPQSSGPKYQVKIETLFCLDGHGEFLIP
jgi:hypothetical protein